MSSGFEKLKEIGAQRIHETTHITKLFAQEILNETFDGMTKVQYFGFISILEREYGLDLDDLKIKALEYYEENEVTTHRENGIISAVDNKKSKNTFIIILIAILVTGAVFTVLSLNDTPKPKIDDSAIENAAKNIEPEKSLIKDVNNTKVDDTLSIVDTNTTKKIKEEAKKEEVAVIHSLKLIPKTKIWMGFIEIKTNKKKQDVFRKEFSLDVDKDWLLLLGPGTVKLEVNGEIQKFRSKQNMRFKYVDGELTKISVEEFKKLNKGRKW